jgi:3-hydroxyacyl-CoA dehydrogenase/enoyl-CoA hydratase/3-hydroxybutyryl-CoA epimerase
MGTAYPDGAVDAVLFALADKGRMGRKASAGLYAYDDKGGRLGLWEGLSALWPVGADQPGVTEVQHRLMMVQVLEAVRALEEGVLTDIREGDVGAILGWGFAPWSGGPFSWLDMIGAEKAVAICDGLETAHGVRFAAPELLRGMAAKGESFYGRFGSGAKAA